MTKKGVKAFVIKTKSVDKRLVIFEPKHSRLWVAGLCAWGHCADFDKSKAKAREGIDMGCLLV